MQKLTEIALGKASRGVFTRLEASHWVESTGPRLDALLKRALANGEVVHIQRNLYCLATRYLREPINPLELAPRMLAPSYVSLETALAHHAWIPEAVYAITSVSLARSRSFDTPLGLFTYTRVPQYPLLTGTTRESLPNGGAFVLASPLKAIADYVYVHRHEWTSAAPLVESLRIDDLSLHQLTGAMFDQLEPIYRVGRVRRFLAELRKDLNV